LVVWLEMEDERFLEKKKHHRKPIPMLSNIFPSTTSTNVWYIYGVQGSVEGL
jgi:hypothetical protein